MIERGTLAPGQPLPAERDLCKHLGVTRSTMNRALNILAKEGVVTLEGPHTRIVAGPPNSLHAGLMRETVAILTPVPTGIMTDHFCPGWADHIGKGAIDAARAAGMHLLSLNPNRLEGDWANLLAASKPQGIIVTDVLRPPVELREHLEAFARHRIPVVVYGDAPEFAPFDRVASNHHSGAYQLTRWLISQHRRRILPVFLAPLSLPWVRQRYAGYEQAMREAGLEPLSCLEVPAFPYVTVDAAEFQKRVRFLAGSLIEQFMAADSPDALLLTSDGDIPVAAAACRLFKREPGRNVLLAGYDHYWQDTPERAFESTPPAATIDKLNARMGAQLVSVLTARLANQFASEPQLLLVEPELVTPVE